MGFACARRPTCQLHFTTITDTQHTHTPSAVHPLVLSQHNGLGHDRQGTYNVTWWRNRAAVVAVGKQWVLHNLGVCVCVCVCVF